MHNLVVEISIVCVLHYYAQRTRTFIEKCFLVCDYVIVSIDDY